MSWAARTVIVAAATFTVLVLLCLLELSTAQI